MLNGPVPFSRTTARTRGPFNEGVLLQVYMGGNSFPQALLALSYHMVFGGCYVSECFRTPRSTAGPRTT